ncbi:MAG: acyl-ACP--UDP-N-acetylglucosamine O-acyltransferase [Planctomycetes bacterium]|nr:acyl-ACP--UDP-N-acetylglucosamine O-acyltransferase [Planctomycetota bacterium]
MNSTKQHLNVHPTAIVQDGARIASDAQVGPYCVIGPNVKIGPGCRLHSHVIVDGDTEIGEGCNIFPTAVIGTQPQDKRLEPGYQGKLRIGNFNEIREGATVHGGTEFGGGVTIVGNHNMLLAGCHIGHDAVVGSHTVFTNGAMAAGHTQIADYVILGAMAGIHQFGRIGARAMIGAGAMMSHDAPPFAMVQGDRARLVGVNKEGLKRGGFSAEEIAVIKRVYRLLFWRDGVLEKRIADARQFAGENVHAEMIIDFVATSERGICATRGRTSRGEEGEASASIGS